MTERSSLVEQYAARGWSVFPCKPGQKQPGTRSGLYAGTDDLVTLRGWWKNTDFNIGINCGGSGLVVVDLDVDKKHEDDLSAGINWWITICDQVGEEPFTTYSVVTPSGGLHLYFELPAGITVPSKSGVLATHVDIKSNGGYVLAAGSSTDVGDYEWIAPINEVMPLPAWLQPMIVPYVLTDEELREQLQRRVAYTKAIDKDHVGTIRKAAERMFIAIQGERNDMLNKIAYGLYMSTPEHLVDQVEDELKRCGSAAGLTEAEIRDTLRSARRAARGD